MFSEKQKEFMRKIGLSFHFDHLTDAEYDAIEEKVTDHLQRYGFDADYNPTKDGLMCESILDQL